MNRNIVFGVLFILSALHSFAQVKTRYYQEGDTACFVQDYLRLDRNTRNIRMPAFDIEKMQKEDAEMEGLDVPYRFGKGFDVSYTLSDGLWQVVDGGKLWTLTFESEGAISLNYIFENMHLPEGASLFIMNQDKTVVYGPVTSEVSVPRGSTFLTDVIPGASSTIYLFEPLAKINESTLTIKRVVHGYRGFDYNLKNRLQGDANSCNIDVACYPAYENESEGVALVMLSNGNTLCSGSLLMSTNLSFDPYFLTAFHCIDSNKDSVLLDSEKQAAENWMFKFCFKKTACNGSSLAQSYTYNRADFCSAWYNTDFALMRLKSSVSQNPDITWLGWDKSSSTPTSGAGIHHPKGDVMKISIDNNQFGTSSTYLVNNGWSVHFDNGIIEGGSSGSPILNQDKRVVGQLCGGDFSTNPCNQTNGSYGKFFMSWTGGGTDDTRLSNWLDPVGTNQTTINSCHPIGIDGDDYIRTSSVYCIDNLPSGYTVVWSLNNSYYNQNCLQQNTPFPNECSITCSSSQVMLNATLTAEIKYNGNTIQTLTKNGLFAYQYWGHYTSGNLSGNIDESYFFHVKPNATTYITSPLLVGATASYSSGGAIPSIWGFSSTYGDITFVTTNTSVPVIINVDDTYGNHYELYAWPSNYNINVSNGDSGITISLVENDHSERGISLDQLWTIEIRNATTGELMATQSSTSRSATISTLGWPKGIYIIKVTIGKEMHTEKFIVK
jgi:hypothetical protein